MIKLHLLAALCALALAPLSATQVAAPVPAPRASASGPPAPSGIPPLPEGLSAPVWDGAFGVEPGVGGFSGNQSVTVAAVYDDGLGGGPMLYVGGSFVTAGGVHARKIARWDGSTWSAVPGVEKVGAVLSLHAHDDGTGLALFAGGTFGGPGASSYSLVKRWDGATWFSLGSGLNKFPTLNTSGRIDALETFDDGSGYGPSLVVGGLWTYCADCPEGASYLARWGGAWDGVNNWTDLGFALAGVSGDPLLVGTGSLAYGSYNTIDLSNAAPSALSGLFVAVTSTPIPFMGGTLIPNPFLPPIFVTTSPTGTIPLPFLMPGEFPSGLELYLQWAITDGAAVALGGDIAAPCGPPNPA